MTFLFCKCGVGCSKMTLVLPFGGDQIANNNLFLRSGSNQNSSMPCVFENDAFEGDFESALMRDWASEINDYEMSTGDSSIKAPSGESDYNCYTTINLFEFCLLLVCVKFFF